MADLGPRQGVFAVMETRASTDEDRLAGFRQALKDAGLGEPIVLSYRREEGDGWPCRRSAVKHFVPRLKELTPPLGVFCHNDYTAVGVYRSAEALGWTVGRDIFVVGFDDDPICVAMSPELTTVRQPAEAMGARAASLLMERLGGQVSRDEVRREALSVELVRRGSA